MFLLIIIAVLILCFVSAPIIMAANREKLKEMEQVIDKYLAENYASPEAREARRAFTKRKLIELKNKIYADKQSLEKATELIASI